MQADCSEGLSQEQEAYLLIVLQRYQDNLEFMRDRFPKAFSRLMETECPIPFEPGTDGSMLLRYRGLLGSVDAFTELSQTVFDNFEDPDKRPMVRLSAPWLDDPLSATPHRDYACFVDPLEPRYRDAIVEEFQRRHPESVRTPRPDFGERVVPIVLVFGMGIGRHLEALVNTYEIRHLQVIETDAERFNLALYFVDLTQLFASFERKGFYFSLIFETDPQTQATAIAHSVSRNWPPYMFQGAAMLINDYDLEAMRETYRLLRAEIEKTFLGWGFLDDELLGLRQALENSRRGYPVFRMPALVPPGASAIIVGSGPSLDGLLPFLRESRDKAVIFSCGSALSALARAGIRPDFHIEIERTETTYHVLQDSVPADFLKDIPLIGSTILYPDVYTMTAKPLMFLKAIDVGTVIHDFFQELPKLYSNPTCTNGGVALTLALGFDTVYLVGVDLGFRSREYHHSKNSLYAQAYADPEGTAAWIAKAAKYDEGNTSEVPGNFCETVFSSMPFIHSRNVMGSVVVRYPDAKVYNLNDGAAIDGTLPLQAANAVVLPAPDGKEGVLERIFASFSSDANRDADAALEMLAVQVDAVAADLALIFGREIAGKMDAVDILHDMYGYFMRDQVHRSSQVFPMLRGALLHISRFFYDCLALIASDDEAADYGRYALGQIVEFVLAAAAAVRGMKVSADRGAA